MEVRSSLVLVLTLALAACASESPAPKVGKGLGESCRVSTECAANLRCANDQCVPGTCSDSTDCTGPAPEGCAGWTCTGGVCEPDCPRVDSGVVSQPDASPAPDDAGVVFLDAEPAPDARAEDAEPPIDTGIAPDAGELDAGVADSGMVAPDAGVVTDGGVTPDSGGAPDSGVIADSGVAVDSGVVADSGVAPDSGALTDSGVAPDASVVPDAGSTCTAAARAPMAGDLVINEILAAPSSVDVNGDGTASSTQDEFVEIGNASSAPLLLQGVVLSDSVQVRHTFGAYTLDCGKVIVVFGGGNPAAPGWRTNWVIASSASLGLNNTGDTVKLGTATATPDDLATYTYGSEANRSESVVRAPDLTGPTPLVRHSLAPGSGGALYSPGVRVDGTGF